MTSQNKHAAVRRGGLYARPTSPPTSSYGRRSIRLQGYDYASRGAYFVTVCTQDRKCAFGKIMENQMILNDLGIVVDDSWQWLTKQYPYIHLGEWTVMPNHLHGIIFIADCRGGSRTAHGGAETAHGGASRGAPTEKIKPLGQLIGVFKTISTKQINGIRRTPGMPLWQRNYYEHIIRNEDELGRIRQYILDNPKQWALDTENPNSHIVGAPREAPRRQNHAPKEEPKC